MNFEDLEEIADEGGPWGVRMKPCLSRRCEYFGSYAASLQMRQGSETRGPGAYLVWAHPINAYMLINGDTLWFPWSLGVPQQVRGASQKSLGRLMRPLMGGHFRHKLYLLSIVGLCDSYRLIDAIDIDITITIRSVARQQQRRCRHSPWLALVIFSWLLCCIVCLFVLVEFLFFSSFFESLLQ